MSTSGVVVRFLAGLVAGIACGILVVGCSGAVQKAAPQARTSKVLGAGEDSGAWASDAELVWLKRLGTWNSRLLAGLRKAGQIEASPKLVRKLLDHDGQTTIAHGR